MSMILFFSRSHFDKYAKRVAQRVLLVLKNLQNVRRIYSRRRHTSVYIHVRYSE